MSKKRALVIGNSKYQDARLAQLTTPGKDAKRLSDVLGSKTFCGFDEVNLCLDSGEQEIRRLINRFLSDASQDDLSLLYYSGHGVLDEQGLLYFAALDTSWRGLRATAIPAHYVRQEMDFSRCRRQILILDCCYSGAYGRTKSPLGQSVGTAVAFDVRGYGRIVLTATDATQYAWEDESVTGISENSLFTHFLALGIETGEADLDMDGEITVDEWYEYAHSKVVSATSRQTPLKMADRQQGQLVVATVRRSPSTSATADTKTNKVNSSPKVAPKPVAEQGSGLNSGRLEVGETEVRFDFRLNGSITGIMPSTSEVLDPVENSTPNDDIDRKRVVAIENSLRFHGAPAIVVEINRGPVFSEFGVEPDFVRVGRRNERVRINSIVELRDDLATALGAPHLFINPTPSGRGYVGICIPNTTITAQQLRDIAESEPFRSAPGPLVVGLGRDVRGFAVVESLPNLRHVMVCAAPGYGKTTTATSMLTSLLFRNTPNDLRILVMTARPAEYDWLAGSTHLLMPIVQSRHDALRAFRMALAEMESRYQLFAGTGDVVKSLAIYNWRHPANALPYIVAVVDEISEFLDDKGEMRALLGRLAYLGQNVGIHVVGTTSRPTDKDIQELLANSFPSRIALRLRSAKESRSTIGRDGAEDLMIRGDALLQVLNSAVSTRFQVVLTSTYERERLVQHWQGAAPTDLNMPEKVEAKANPPNMRDEPLIEPAIIRVRQWGTASTSRLQRAFGIGYSRAARLMDVLEEMGVVGPPTTGAKPRIVFPAQADTPMASPKTSPADSPPVSNSPSLNQESQ